MRHQHILLLLVFFFIGVFYSEPTHAQQISARDLALHWKPTPQYDGKENLGLSLVVKNIGKIDVRLDEWDLFFNSMYPALNIATSNYKVTDLRGNLFKVEFAKRTLRPNDSLQVDYTTQYAISGISTAPNGFYLLKKSDQKTVVGIDNVTYTPIQLSKEQNVAYLEKLYTKNKLFDKPSASFPIFPTPKYVKELSGKFSINRILKVNAAEENITLLERELKRIFVVEKDNSAQADVQLVRKESLPKEAYNLIISKTSIKIEFSTSAGLFYALQSIKSLHKGLADKSHLPCLEVRDDPRYAYRGFMLDIARNFRDKSVVLKYLDLMAENKLNVFHFHFIEDEAWRIEIPGLPELTEVGARRSPLYHLGHALQPAYGSSVNEAKQYLTRQDFIEILKYAHDRHIQVVPEIETPGHARASIKAMEYRYHKYMKAGNKQAAEEYLLHDFEDKSEYNTPQNFGDNVLNPALPSVYKFLDKVLTEFKSMYDEANVPFYKVSLGGDEVPPGVWEKSPKIKALMDKEGLNSVYEVWTYYFSKINDLCIAKGLHMAGWEEAGMVNKGKGMQVNPDMPNKHNMQLDVWNNIIGGGQDDLVYKLANAGYPTVLISSSNTYFDMMWDTSFEEPGLKWATYADLYHSYSLFPEDYFANIHTYYSGAKLAKSYTDKLVRITEKGRANFLGIKGGVFAETILKDENLDYLTFPRFYVLAERAWSSRRGYESESNYDQKKFDKDYTSFLHRIGQVELPSIAHEVKFRLPRVGLKLENGTLKANIEYPGFNVYYTTDGSLPTLQSKRYDMKTGVKVRAGQKITAAVVDEMGRAGLPSIRKVD